MIEKIRRELKKMVDEKYKQGMINFFTEDIRPHGVRTGEARKIGAKYWKEIKNKNKREMWKLCEGLWQSGWFEEGIIAIDWSWRMKKNFVKADMKIFEEWLKKYVKNWAHCDDFCTHAMGYFMLMYPEFLGKLDKWAAAKNRWLRRAAAVTLIYPVRKEGKYLGKIFEIADKLLEDEDDLVRKGYGWMLKEASNVYPKKVFNYIMRRKDKMPRVSLRYAIEKMPKKWKQEAMRR